MFLVCRFHPLHRRHVLLGPNIWVDRYLAAEAHTGASCGTWNEVSARNLCVVSIFNTLRISVRVHVFTFCFKHLV